MQKSAKQIPRAHWSSRRNTGDFFSGRVEFVGEPRGFSGTIRELNDGFRARHPRPGKIEVQAWLSAFSVPPAQVEAFGKKWSNA
jgi:hypothetical protein